MKNKTDFEISLLCVCLGNICRSPLAEAAFKEEAKRLGIKAFIDSAGTGSWHIGDPPDIRAQQTALKHGIDISSYKGRQIQDEDFLKFDYIFALDRENLRNLQAMRNTDTTAKIMLLMDCVPGKEGKAVPDPYYGTIRDFEQTWQAVREAAAGFFAGNRFVEK